MHTFLAASLLAFTGTAITQPGAASAETPGAEISSDQLLADLEIARDAYTSLHPGLYRYNTPEEIDARFAALQEKFTRPIGLRETYLAFAETLAAFRCGHTYANFWNQPEENQERLFRGADKVPFTFSVVDEGMVVTASATDDARVRPGVLVTAIDGVPTKEMLERLTTFMHADGSSDHQRRFELQVTGIGDFEPFDVYQPLLYPPTAGRYRFAALDVANETPFEFTAKAVSREERRALLEERLAGLAATPDELWQFERLDHSTAYLKLGSFVTWKMELDWKRFLAEAFATVRDEHLENLILDIRGNSGGDDEVLAVLAGHLFADPITLPPSRQLLRYEKAPERLLAYLDTWDRSFLDRTGKVRPEPDGFFTWKDAALEPTLVPGTPGAFTGKLFLLIDPANSSATFILARAMKESGRAVLVGQPTGGNRRGINGGQILFLRLPHSGIEMDIPVIAYFPMDEQPDGGIEPDVLVEPRLAHIASGVDTVLEATRRLIADGDD